MSAIFASFVVSLLAANSGRAYDRLRNEVENINRESDYSVDLDSVETEFQRSLQDQINEQVEDYLAEPLSEAIEPWDLFVNELHGIESGSSSVEEIDAGDHDWLAVKTEEEAVDQIVDTWIRIAERNHDESIPPQPVRKVVIKAYNESVDRFHEEIAGTELADEALLGSLDDLRERLASLAADNHNTNVYKSRTEFERLSTLFDHQPDYVPVTAELETIDIDPETDTIKVEDAKEEILHLLNEGIDLIAVSGDGGAGKSRLLAAVGEELENHDTLDVYYVTNSLEQKPLPLDRDTVLFVDDAGREDMEYFLRKAVPEERRQSKRNHTVQVVAATRSVYDETLEGTVTGLGTADTRSLKLDNLDESDILKLIEYYDLSEDTVNHIVDRSDGNPFFALLIARLAAEGRKNRLTIKEALADVVGEMTSSEADLNQVAETDSAQAVERWLEALALWQHYIEPDDKELITEQAPGFTSPSARRRQLDSLAKNGYFDKSEMPEVGSFEYSHRYDVLADYLRFEIIKDDQHYPYLQRGTLSEKAPGVARGVVDLKGSPLSRLYANMDEEIEELVGWLAEEILNVGLSLHHILEAENHLMQVAPNRVPLNEILDRIDSSNEPNAWADPMVRFTGSVISYLTSEKEPNLAAEWLHYADKVYNRGDIESDKYAKLLSHAIRQYGAVNELDRVEEIVEKLRQLPESGAHEEIAVGLANSANIYGKLKHFSKLEATLSYLRDLYGRYPESDIHVPLAMGLMNTAAGYGGLEHFREAEAALSELRELHEEYPEIPVSKQLGMGLANAVTDYGEARRFKDAEEALSDLRELHSKHSEAIIREELAIGLYNAAINYGKAKKFSDMETILSELNNLHEIHQEAAIREELADGLSEAAAHYSVAKQMDDVEMVVSELEDLHQEYPESHIREKLSSALHNMSVGYANMKQWGDVREVLSKLRKLHQEYPEVGIRRTLSLSLANTAGELCKSQRWDDLDSILTELRDLHEEYPDAVIRSNLATGLTYAVETNCNEMRFDPVKEYVDELSSIVDAHGDLGGFEEKDRFSQAFQKLILDLFNHVPETALTAVDLMAEITDKISVLQLQVKLGQEAERLHNEGVITTETYRKILDRL
ncbi:hypothetical protein [Natrinema sp. CGMCC1.2065]|uniref:hypothetical protein n=1 Tax=Natrinema sp. CGMCC1.2065 TaxID=3445767 RepID=UPI003F4A0411